MKDVLLALVIIAVTFLIIMGLSHFFAETTHDGEECKVGVNYESFCIDMDKKQAQQHGGNQD